MKKLPLVVVEWVDIAGVHSWVDEERSGESEPISCITVGWKLKATPKKLVIIGSRADSGDCTDRTTIPRNAIKSIRRIE